MDNVQSPKPVTVICPSCGAEIVIEDTMQEFLTCGYCNQVHQISDLLKESNEEQISRLQEIQYRFPLRNIKLKKQPETEEAPKAAFKDTPQGAILRCVILCLMGMMALSVLCLILKPLIPLGLSLACCISYWRIADGKTEAKDPGTLKVLAVLAVLFFVMTIFI